MFFPGLRVQRWQAAAFLLSVTSLYKIGAWFQTQYISPLRQIFPLRKALERFFVKCHYKPNSKHAVENACVCCVTLGW